MAKFSHVFFNSFKKNFLFIIYLFVLHFNTQDLWSLLQHVGYSFLTRDQTQVPDIESVDSDHQGSPLHVFWVTTARWAMAVRADGRCLVAHALEKATVLSWIPPQDHYTHSLTRSCWEHQLLSGWSQGQLRQVSGWELSQSIHYLWGFPGGSEGKMSACNVGDPGSIPGFGRSPGEENGNPLWYSCLENSMDREA